MLPESLAVLACLKFTADAAGTRACGLLVFTDDPGKQLSPKLIILRKVEGCHSCLGGKEKQTGLAMRSNRTDSVPQVSEGFDAAPCSAACVYVRLSLL